MSSWIVRKKRKAVNGQEEDAEDSMRDPPQKEMKDHLDTEEFTFEAPEDTSDDEVDSSEEEDQVCVENSEDMTIPLSCDTTAWDEKSFMRVSRYVNVGDLYDFQTRSRVVEVNVLVQGVQQTVSIAIFPENGQLFAMDDACPHAGGSLHLGDIEDGFVSCRWHGWRFSLVSGRCEGRSTAAKTYKVDVRGAQVWLEVADEIETDF